MPLNPRRSWNRRSVIISLLFVSGLGLSMGWTSVELLSTSGPMNTGHEELACADCHRAERGTIRQQIQGAFSHWRGQREDVVYVGTRPVESAPCLACHDRPTDRHPIYRFREPRFAEAREEIGADQCLSCHGEHSGVRVTQEQGFCQTCHDGLEMKNDPIDVPHVDLVAANNWTSCLTCHDFHGNHIYDVPLRMDDAFSESDVDAYLGGEQMLYSEERKHSARTSLP